MSKRKMSKPTIYKVVSSPYEEDDNLPWEYEEDAFVNWVDEVFLEGYKKPDDAPFPGVEECLDVLHGAGYEVEVSE